MHEHEIFTDEDYRRKADYDDKLIETTTRWQAYFDQQKAKEEGIVQGQQAKELELLL